jgi:SAM-dependent methyltransferase
MREIATENIIKCELCGSSSNQVISENRDFEFETCSNLFTFLECSDCGYIWMRNRPSTLELSTIYPETYSTYNYNDYLGRVIANLRSIVQRLKIQLLRRHIPKTARVADIGCGNAELLRLIQLYGGQQWQLFGVDIADESMKRLGELGITGIQSRFENINEAEIQFDAIIMNQVIEHLEKPMEIIAKAHNLLSQGGLLILETPSIDGWDAKLFKKRYWGGWHTPRHWQIFSEATLTQALEQQGFVVTRVDYMLNPYAWLHSLRFYLLEKYNRTRFSRFFEVNFFPSLLVASGLDVIQRLVRRKTSNIRIFATKI